MTIRPATEKDIPRIGELLRQVCTVHANLRPDIFVPGARKYTDDELREILRDPARPILAAADGTDTLIGYVFCVVQSHAGVMTAHKTLYLDDLCVDEVCRGQGVGAALYDAAVALAKVRGCHNLTLNVWQGNDTALRFYEARGMQVQKIGMEVVL